MSNVRTHSANFFILVVFVSMWFGTVLCFADSDVTFVTSKSDDAKIDQLCAKTAAVSSVQYERETTSDGPNAKTAHVKVWQKGHYRRIDGVMGANSRMILGPEGIYFYNSMSDSWSKLPGNQKSAGPNCEWMNSDEQPETIQEKKILGSETVDGKPCTIISLSGDLGGTSFSSKEWVWNDNGLELKEELSLISNGKVISKTTSQNSHFKFEDISDDMFTVPKDKMTQRSLQF